MVRDCAPAPVTFTGVWDTVGSVATTGHLALLTGGDHSSSTPTSQDRGARLPCDGDRREPRRLRRNIAVVPPPEHGDDAIRLATTARRRRAALVLRRPRRRRRWDLQRRAGAVASAMASAKASSHGLAFKRNVELDAEATTAAIEDSFSDFLGGAYKVYSPSATQLAADRQRTRDAQPHDGPHDQRDNRQVSFRSLASTPPPGQIILSNG